MTDFLIYDVKVAVLIAVFYMFYRILLAKETFHRVNRIVLLATAIASFVMPFCVITLHETVMMPMPQVDVEMGAAVVEAVAPQTPWWQIVLPALFFVGVAVVLGHTLLSIIRLILLIKRSEQHPLQDGIIVCVTGNTAMSPFSWMHYIVMNRSDYEESDASILAHERGHIRLRHSWDVLLVDTLTALQWFNPAMWMLRSDLRAIHEYEADAAVLSQGINARQYQYLLISKAAGIGGYYLANGISHSTLKNRINMMLHTKSNRSRLLKVLAFLPIVAAVLAVNAEKVTEVKYVNTSSAEETVVESVPVETVQLETTKTPETALVTDMVVTDTVKANTNSVSAPIFDVVDEMPQFPGGHNALLEFLTKNIKYPKSAEKEGIQGRVIVTFVVDKDGTINNQKVVKSVHPALDAEALRIVGSMPKWVPGKQNGQPVAVKYTIPVTFRLQGGDSEVAKYEGTIKYDPESKSQLNELVIVGYDQKPASHVSIAYDTKNTDKHPLVIVDGQTIEPEKIKDIDPKTIDHIDILKDKSAIEKYGEKAKNGVVVVTLKKKK